MKGEAGNNGVETLASHRIKGVLPRKYHMEYRSGREELVEEKSLKEVEEMILAVGENLETPEGLLPENMSRKLEFVREERLRRRRHLIKGCVVCAVIILLLFSFLYFV